MFTSFVLRSTRAVGVLAFFGLGGYGLVQILDATHVREFQAGPPSGWAERWSAFVQRAAIEGLGFASCGLACALVGALLGPLVLPRRDEPRPGPRFGGLALAAGTLWLWADRGSYFANEYLPYLEPGSLLLVTLAGCAVFFALFALHARLVALLPAMGARSVGALGLGSAVGLGWALPSALRAVQEAPAGATSPGALLTAAAYGVGSLVAAWVVARLLDPLLSGWAAREHPLVSRAATLGTLLLLACAVATPFLVELPASRPAAEPALVESDAPRGLPNVVYVVVDTLRADALGCYGYPRPTSPFLDRCADEGAVFEDAMSSASWTKPSTATILTGLYPSRHGALHHGSSLRLPEGERTLAETFASAGYATAAFVTNPNVKRVFDFDRGFDAFFDSPVEDTVTLAALRDSVFGTLLTSLTRRQFNWKYENDVLQMNRHILPWLEANRDQRFFLYLHYIDPHSPYSPPARWRREFSGDHGLVLHNERKRLVGRDRYDAEVRFADEGLEQLGEKLAELGHWDDTLFVLTSDHGEEWFEKDVLGHGYSLYQPAIHVPLIVRGPGVPAGLRVSWPVELVDLPATVAELAGILSADGGTTPRHGDGASFAAALSTPEWSDPEPAYLENEFGMTHDASKDYVSSGIREGRWKLVLTQAHLDRPPGDDFPSEELYDLEHDPQELDNLFFDPEQHTRVSGMLQRLQSHGSFLAEHGLRSDEPAMLSEDVRAQLEQLGYLGG